MYLHYFPSHYSAVTAGASSRLGNKLQHSQIAFGVDPTPNRTNLSSEVIRLSVSSLLLNWMTGAPSPCPSGPFQPLHRSLVTSFWPGANREKLVLRYFVGKKGAVHKPLHNCTLPMAAAFNRFKLESCVYFAVLRLCHAVELNRMTFWRGRCWQYWQLNCSMFYLEVCSYRDAPRENYSIWRPGQCAQSCLYLRNPAIRALLLIIETRQEGAKRTGWTIELRIRRAK